MVSIDSQVDLNEVEGWFAHFGLSWVGLPTSLNSDGPSADGAPLRGVDGRWLAESLRALNNDNASALRLLSIGHLESPEQTRSIIDWYAQTDVRRRPQVVVRARSRILDSRAGRDSHRDASVMSLVRTRHALLPVATGWVLGPRELQALTSGARSDRASVAALTGAAETLLDSGASWVVVVGARLPVAQGAGLTDIVVTHHQSQALTRPESTNPGPLRSALFTAVILSGVHAGISVREATRRAGTWTHG